MKKSPLVFYTDDDADDQDIFKEVLSGIDTSVTVQYQNNAGELLSALQNAAVTPDILFLDLNMPGKTGFEALQEIREKEKFKNLAIAILSTSGEVVLAERAKQLGANLFITKPKSYSSFKKAMKLVLSIDWSKYSPATNEFFINLNK